MLLTEDRIRAELATLPGWEYDNGALRKSFRFATYLDGIRFVQALAAAAEEANHHPDLHVGYKVVTIFLTTHDAGGVTQKDVELAWKAENIATIIAGQA
jgi:4a-hydroxytetrahydrobiopterin dehydratase